MISTPTDLRFMRLALRLAAKGAGRTSPNPMVGAVIVVNGRRVGQGYHAQVGGPHAEVHALRQAGHAAHGSTMYVTLEPCCHSRKRTPPCVPDIIKAGIRRVVVAMPDPNPNVSGRGIRQLKRAGLIVDVGCLEREARELNEGYVHWIQTGRPAVILKAAMTLDGKIATAAGESQWITGERARRHVHTLRAQVDAILVGVGTVLRDNPRLTARRDGVVNAVQPLRIVLDSRLRIPLSANILQSSGSANVLIATTAQAANSRREQLRKVGAAVWVLPQRAGKVSLLVLFKRLGAAGITRVLVEGGGEVNGELMRLRLVHRVLLYVAPLLLGGNTARSLLEGVSPVRLRQAVSLTDWQFQSLDPDMLVTGICRYPQRDKRTSS